MTKTEERLLAAMKAAVASGAWTVISGDTIRWKSKAMLPDPRLLDRDGKVGGWQGDWAYHQIVFLTLIPGRARILGLARAPWLERQDINITFKWAFEALADPASQF